MKDINSTILIGRLTKDMDVAYTQQGLAVGKFSIAFNTLQKDGDRWTDVSNFVYVYLYGQKAENMKQMLLKGTKICVQGKLLQKRWQSARGSESMIAIAADEIQVLSPRKSASDYAPQQEVSAQTDIPQEENVQNPPPPAPSFDEIPFDIV